MIFIDFLALVVIQTICLSLEMDHPGSPHPWSARGRNAARNRAQLHLQKWDVQCLGSWQFMALDQGMVGYGYGSWVMA